MNDKRTILEYHYSPSKGALCMNVWLSKAGADGAYAETCDVDSTSQSLRARGLKYSLPFVVEVTVDGDQSEVVVQFRGKSETLVAKCN